MKGWIAGSYKQQHSYRSFTPSFVNRHFDWEDPEIDVLMEKVTYLLGELNTYATLIPDVDFFLKMTVTKEARSSNQLEGTRTEINEVILPQDEVPPVRRDDTEEVQNYIRAMNFAVAELPRMPISTRLLKDIHKRLLAGVRGRHKAPGEIRKTQNWIGGASLDTAFFVPPSPEELPDLLTDLEKFWHNESLQLPVLIKVAMTHYQFETIHPFLDGNGRCGRLLIVLQLIDAGFLEKPSLYVSTFFDKNKEVYYHSLTAVRDSNDLEQWIVFFLRILADAAVHTRETFKTFMTLRAEYDAQILTLGVRANNAQRLLLFLYGQPIVKVNDVVDAVGINYQTANRLLKSLVEIGILTEITGYSRNRFFVLGAYLNLFRD